MKTYKFKDVIPHMIVFFGIVILFLLTCSEKIPLDFLDNMPDWCFALLGAFVIFLLFASGSQMAFKISYIVGAKTNITDLQRNGIMHDLVKPTPDFIEKDKQVPVHETVLDKLTTPSLLFAPKLHFTVTFQPEADKCTFLLSNGYSCSAEASMVSENNYFIQWHTLSWNAPLSDRLSKQDKTLVAQAFTQVDKKTIVWPFTDKQVNILMTKNTYY